ncbi:MAG: hypothetical protein HOP13_00110 [Alphaproteobacteria bacterium]|nr:hypothetical protein [Alphaproteobacteria bacterium]
MTSLIAKFVLAAALALASGVGLIGVSGLIIFADLKAPQPASVLQTQPLSSGTQPLPFTGR